MPNGQFYAVPGDTQTVEVNTGPSGTPPVAHDAVGVAQSTNKNPSVSTPSSSVDAYAVGVLLTDAEDYDSSQSYGSNVNLGKATVAIMKPIVPVKADSAYAPSVGDYVAANDAGEYVKRTGPTATGQGGAVSNNLGIDANGNLETDNASDIDLNMASSIEGVVWDPNIPEFNTADMAVAFIR